MDIVKIGLLALAGVLFGLQFRSGRQEYSLYIGICTSLLIFAYAARYLIQVKDRLKGLEVYFSSGSQYFGILFKVVGITYLCEFCAGICRDAGYQSVAAQIELFGKIAILFAGLPVLLALVEIIAGFGV